ncbi:FmdB family zinc ribbon protein [Georgenia muralis]
MPTYAYRCTVCGHEFEAKQSFSDDALTVCPECGGALRKLFSSVGVVFKGSGFYRNDSRLTSTSTAPASEPAKTAPPKEAAKPASTTAAPSTAAKSTAAKSAG